MVYCVCACIKSHMTAQSGAVILAFLCYFHWSSQGLSVPFLFQPPGEREVKASCKPLLNIANLLGNVEEFQTMRLFYEYLPLSPREPLFATPCCNTSRATWSTPSEPSHKKPFFEVLSFSALFGTGCCCQLVLNLVCLISVCPCIPETGRLENTYSCVFLLWSWLAAVVNLFVLNLLCFISVCLYPKRADCRTRTYREQTKKTLPRRPGHARGST